MEQQTGASGTTVQVPLDLIIREKQSQRDRRLLEIMEALFARLPDKPGNTAADFTLADGTECRIVKFAVPRERDGKLWYGFDVKLDRGPLDHLEFSVECSGWGGGV
jgi:hypothetical protein